MENTTVDLGKKPQGAVVETAKKAEKEPKPWFVIDGETRRLTKAALELNKKQIDYNPDEPAIEGILKRELEEIEKQKPIELFTPEDGMKLLKALNQTVGDVRLEAEFVRSDGKTVEVKDYGTTGIIIEIPKEVSGVLRAVGPHQCLRLGEAAYLFAELQFGLKSLNVGVKLDTEGITVKTSSGYNFSPEKQQEILNEAKVNGGKGKELLTNYYNDLAKDSSKFPGMRRELGAPEGKELKPL